MAKKTIKKTVKKAEVSAAAPKKAAKATTAKKPETKPAAKPKAIKKINEKLSKTQLMTLLAEQTGLPRKDVNNVFAALETIIDAAVKKGGIGEFTIPGLVKIATLRKKATKEREGVNPFTGEKTVFKAKPARTVVKVRPLKKLKDMVA